MTDACINAATFKNLYCLRGCCEPRGLALCPPMVGQAFSTLGTINRDGAGYELDVIRAKKTRRAGGYVGAIG